MNSFVKDAVATTEDALGNLLETIGRLDYELEVYVDSKDTQADTTKLARVADYRASCREFIHDIHQFISETDKFKGVING